MIAGLFTLILKTTQSAKNLSLLIVENIGVGSNDNNYKDEIIKKLLFKNLNRALGFLTSNIKKAFT